MSCYDLTLPAPRLKMGAWRTRGACRDAPQEWFFPPKGTQAISAKAVCADCPVKAECLDWALKAPEKYGVWGATTERERRGRYTRICGDCEARISVRENFCAECRAVRARETQRLARQGTRMKQREAS